MVFELSNKITLVFIAKVSRDKFSAYYTSFSEMLSKIQWKLLCFSIRRFPVPLYSGEANLSLEEARERPGRRSGRSLEQRAGRRSGAEVGSGGRERRSGAEER